MPTLVLTRPEAQSRAIAAALGDGVAVLISPVMQIAGSGPAPDLAPYRGVILTSANAVPFAPDLTKKRVYCVGKRTAEAARAAGAEIALVAEDAEALLAQIPGPGPLIHLHGEHVRGDVTERLNSGGIETDEAVIYQQKALALTDQARALLEGDAPVVLPLYSPRSAKLVVAALRRVGPQVHTIAMSAAVAEVWSAATGQQPERLTAPTGEEMRARIVAALRG